VVVYNAFGAAFGGLFFSLPSFMCLSFRKLIQQHFPSFLRAKKSQLHGAVIRGEVSDFLATAGNKKPFPRLWKPPSSSRGDAAKRLCEWELWQPTSGLYCVEKSFQTIDQASSQVHDNNDWMYGYFHRS
jgi:hypothetical protein